MATEKRYVSSQKLGLYHEKEVARTAAEVAAAVAESKDYADSLAENYDAAGSAATVQTKLDEEVARAKAAEEANAAAAKKAQDEVDALELVVADKASQADVDALEQAVADLDTYIGDIPEGYEEQTNVIAYINKKAEETLNSASGGSTESAASVKAALDAYKAENDPKVAANTQAVADAQATADAAQDHSEGVAADLAEAVEALEAADAGQVDRIAVLEGQIVGLSGAMHFRGVKDEIPTDVSEYEQGDVIIVGNKEYVLNGEAFIEFGDVSAQAEAIAELTGRMDSAEGAIEEAQADITALEESVAEKAAQSALDAEIAAREAADSAQVARLDAIEAELGDGEGSVAEQIATAKAEAIEEAAAKDAALEESLKKYADDEDAKIEASVSALDAAVAAKAAASDLTALAERVTAAEGEIDILQTEMDAVEAKASANETAIAGLQTSVAEKATIAALEAEVARAKAAEQANADAIAAFVEISEEEVNALFA